MHLNEKAKALCWVNDQTDHGRDMIGHYIGHFIVPKIQKDMKMTLIKMLKNEIEYYAGYESRKDLTEKDKEFLYHRKITLKFVIRKFLENEETTELHTNESNWIAVGSYAYEGIIARAKREGRADLIEKLTSREMIVAILNANDSIPDLMAGSYTNNEILRNETLRIDAVKAVIKKASESLGQPTRESTTLNHTGSSSNSKGNSSPKPENACKKCMLLSSAMDEPTLCPDCEETERNKPKKLNAFGGKELKPSGIYPERKSEKPYCRKELNRKIVVDREFVEYEYHEFEDFLTLEEVNIICNIHGDDPDSAYGHGVAFDFEGDLAWINVSNFLTWAKDYLKDNKNDDGRGDEYDDIENIAKKLEYYEQFDLWF